MLRGKSDPPPYSVDKLSIVNYREVDRFTKRSTTFHHAGHQRSMGLLACKSLAVLAHVFAQVGEPKLRAKDSRLRPLVFHGRTMHMSGCIVDSEAQPPLGACTRRRVESIQVKSSRVESSQVESSRVESSRVESSRVESSQDKSRGTAASTWRLVHKTSSVDCVFVGGTGSSFIGWRGVASCEGSSKSMCMCPSTSSCLYHVPVQEV